MQVREAPWSMTLPMLAMVAIAFFTGWMPGLALALVDKAQAALGIALLPHHLGGVELPNGSLDMLWVVSLLFVALGVSALIYFAGNRSYRVNQLDNYAGGHFLSADVQYHYSHNFYPGLMRVIGTWYRGSVVWLEQGIGNLTEVGASAMQGIYRAAYTPLYLVLAAVLGLWLMAGI
jgi:NADH-quinone oxidoreductase subunit M